MMECIVNDDWVHMVDEVGFAPIDFALQRRHFHWDHIAWEGWHIHMG